METKIQKTTKLLKNSEIINDKIIVNNFISNSIKINNIINYTSEYDTIVISGGAAKGFAALGSMQYMYDNYLLKNIKNYIGTSVGSMICYLLAIGYTPIEIIVYICTKQLFKKIHQLNIVQMLQGGGAIHYSHIASELEKMTLRKIGTFVTLKGIKERFGKKLFFPTYNITKGKTEILSADTYPDLPCLTAIRMSSNLPFMFDKFQYNGNFLY